MEQFPTFENQEKSKLEIVREVLAEKGAEMAELVAELGGEQVFEKRQMVIHLIICLE